MLEKDSYSNQIFSSIKMLIDSSDKSYIILDATDQDFKIKHCNDPYINLVKYSFDDIVGKHFWSFLQEATDYYATITKKLLKGKPIKVEANYLRYHTSPFFAELEFFPFLNEDGRPLYVLLSIRDISYTKVDQLVGRIEKQLFEAIEQNMSIEKKLGLICREMDAFFHPLTFTSFLLVGDSNELLVMNDGTNIVYNHQPKFSSFPMTNVYKEIFLTGKHKIFPFQEAAGLIEEHVQYATQKGMDSCLLYPISNKNNEVIGLFSIYFIYTKGTPTNFAFLKDKISNLVFLAYTYSLTQQRIYELAHKDVATGLDNSTQFIKNLESAISSQKVGYVKIIEPGEFANVVELYGRSMGDKLLQQIAERFKEIHKDEHFYIARFSSSSLIVCRMNDKGELQDSEHDERIRELLHEPYHFDNQKIYITLKTGIASFNSQTDIKDLIRKAETALSFSRKQPGTYAATYTLERSEILKKQMRIMNHINMALEQDELSVYLQPKVSCGDKEIVSMEALVRWHSKELGFVSPADFLPAAESIGKIIDVDNVVIKKVVAWLQKRQHAGKKQYRVAVNISPEHFYAPSFVEDLLCLVSSYEVSPKNLIIEITENTGLVDIEKAINIMKELKKYGFAISVDDFGVGYSSLSYLQKLPFDELKIDRSFTNKITEKGTEAVVRAIIQLAQFFEMETVAEGIESEVEASILKTIGCSTAQGFLYYKPMPIEQVELLLDSPR